MRHVEEVFADDGAFCLRVYPLSDGTYAIQRFEKRFDEEEAVSYMVRSKPDPVGRYANAEMALDEARRLCENGS